MQLLCCFWRQERIELRQHLSSIMMRLCDAAQEV
jgi:hypothetical protein